MEKKNDILTIINGVISGAKEGINNGNIPLDRYFHTAMFYIEKEDGEFALGGGQINGRTEEENDMIVETYIHLSKQIGRIICGCETKYFPEDNELFFMFVSSPTEEGLYEFEKKLKFKIKSSPSFVNGDGEYISGKNALVPISF